ncbi:MAG: hypothetical protein FWG21_01895 [Oscillospiraceae bacterium]|nr:hypothetical protein [Oscillospiraceae bacterium]
MPKNNEEVLLLEVEEEPTDLPLTRLSSAFLQISSNSTVAYFNRVIPDRFLAEFQPEGWTNTYYGYGYQMVYVTDFVSLQTNPLCYITDCTHKDDSCDAWIKSQIANWSLIASEDRLFWIHFVYVEERAYEIGTETITIPEIPAGIEMSNLDGTDRKWVYTADVDCTIDETGLFYDTEKLYTVENARSVNKMQTLVVVDLETLEIENRFDIGIYDGIGGEYVSVIGTYMNEPLFSKAKTTITEYCDNEFINTPYAQPSKYITDIEYFTVNKKTGTIQEITTKQFTQDTTLSDFTGSTFLVIDEVSYDIIEIDIENDTETVVGNLPTEDGEYSFTMNSTIYQGMVLFRHKETGTRYSLNTASGEIKEHTLHYHNQYGGEQIVEIIACIENEFLIVVGMTENGAVSKSPIEYYDIVSGWGGSRYIYAMISCDDYWNSINNYKLISLNF